MSGINLAIVYEPSVLVLTSLVGAGTYLLNSRVLFLYSFIPCGFHVRWALSGTHVGIVHECSPLVLICCQWVLLVPLGTIVGFCYYIIKLCTLWH